MGLSQLWQLQETQLRQQELRRKLQTSNLARELKKEKTRLEIFQGNVVIQKGEVEKVRKETAQLEQTCQRLRDNRKKAEKKLYSGITNNPRELSILQRQVGNIAKELLQREEKTKESTKKWKQLKQALIDNMNKLEAEKTAYKQKLVEYRTWREDLMQEMDIVKVTVHQLEKEIDPQLHNFYIDLQRRLGIKALARVSKGTCSGCNLIIPPMLLADIRAGRRVYCENCGRMLLP